MISRRNIRIKALQSLYAYEEDTSLTFAEAKTFYRKLIMDTFHTYLYALYALVKFCELSVEDAEKRKKKYLPTEADKNFQPILYENIYLQSIAENENFLKKCELEKFDEILNLDILRRLYKAYSSKETYKNYLNRTGYTRDVHIDILHNALRFLKEHESFNEMMEDGYAAWMDDKSLVLGAMKRTLKSLPAEESFFMDFYPNKRESRALGEELMNVVRSKKREIEAIINDILENWDIKRLAIVDLLILKLAIVEMKYFDNIPLSVSVNEYVELAKLYSTEKSRSFINGILHRMLSMLKDKEGK